MNGRTAIAGTPGRAWRLVMAFALVLCGVVTVSSSAVAQDEANERAVVNETLGVTMVAPEGWEPVRAVGNDKSLANFRHPESQSQIEVVGTRLVNSDVATVLFDTFHNQMVATDFTETGAARDTTIGGVDGKMTEYSFEHTGIRLRVVVFNFVRDESAFMVIGYFKDEERETYFPALETVVETLQFS